MPRDAPCRGDFGGSLGIFVARRGGFTINFEWAQNVQNIRVFWSGFCKKRKSQISSFLGFPVANPAVLSCFIMMISREKRRITAVYFTWQRTRFRVSCKRRFSRIFGVFSRGVHAEAFNIYFFQKFIEWPVCSFSWAFRHWSRIENRSHPARDMTWHVQILTFFAIFPFFY